MLDIVIRICTFLGNRGVPGVHVEKLDIREPFKSCCRSLEAPKRRCDPAKQKEVCT